MRRVWPLFSTLDRKYYIVGFKELITKRGIIRRLRRFLILEQKKWVPL